MKRFIVAVVVLGLTVAYATTPAHAQTSCAGTGTTLTVVSFDGQLHTLSDLWPPAGKSYLLVDGQLARDGSSGAQSSVLAFLPGRVTSVSLYQGHLLWFDGNDRACQATAWASAKAANNPGMLVLAQVQYRVFRYWPWSFWRTVWSN